MHLGHHLLEGWISFGSTMIGRELVKIMMMTRTTWNLFDDDVEAGFEDFEAENEVPGETSISNTHTPAPSLSGSSSSARTTNNVGARNIL